jgi:hypothetical protein
MGEADAAPVSSAARAGAVGAAMVDLAHSDR